MKKLGRLQRKIDNHTAVIALQKTVVCGWICYKLKSLGITDIDLSNPPLYEELNDQESRFVATISNDGGVAIRGGGEEAEYLNLSDLSVEIIAEIETAILNDDYEIFE
jgi:hypothetical protein